MILKVIILTIFSLVFEASVSIDQTIDYYKICLEECLIESNDCIYTYSNIPINLKIVCLLRSDLDIDIIQSEDIHHLDFIRSNYKGSCQKPGGISSNVLLYDKLDSKVDFPVGYDEFPDSLRGKIISCIPGFENKKSIKSLKSIRLEIIRNSIDYFSGLTNNSLRNSKVMESSLDEITGLNTIDSNTKINNYPSLGSYRRYEDSDRILRSRELLFDPAPALILGIQIFMKSKTVAHYIKAVTQTAKMIKVTSEMAGTVNTFMELERNVADLIKRDKKDKDIMLKQIQEIMLSGQMSTLEYRKQNLEIQRGILLSNQISNMLLVTISEKLEGIDEKLEEISEQLDEVNEQLENIEDKIEELGKKIDNIDFNVSVYVDIPDLPRNNYGNKVESETSLSVDISEYISEYENLECEDFVTQKHLIQDTCFMYFFLSQESGQISDTDYLKYRYDSTRFLNREDMKEACLMIGGNHPKFTSRYSEMNMSLHTDMIDMDGDESLEFLKTSTQMYLYLFLDLSRSYSIDWFIRVFNIVRKNDGFEAYSMSPESIENFTSFIGNKQSICIES